MIDSSENRKGCNAAAAPPCDRTEEFVRLQTRYQQRVLAFILTLVPNWADAEEILQEASTILWRKFDEFQPGSNFVRWANQVAFYEVQKFRERQKREKNLLFGDEFLHEVAEEVQDATDELQWQRDALADCMNKLSPSDRALIEKRYCTLGSVANLSEAIGRSAESIRKSLQRVRKSLLQCVRARQAREEHP